MSGFKIIKEIQATHTSVAVINMQGLIAVCKQYEDIALMEKELMFYAQLRGKGLAPKLYDYGKQNDIPFLILSYIEGVTVKEYILQGLSENQMQEIVAKVTTLVTSLMSCGVKPKEYDLSNYIIKDSMVYAVDFDKAVECKNANKRIVDSYIKKLFETIN